MYIIVSFVSISSSTNQSLWCDSTWDEDINSEFLYPILQISVNFSLRVGFNINRRISVWEFFFNCKKQSVKIILTICIIFETWEYLPRLTKSKKHSPNLSPCRITIICIIDTPSKINAIFYGKTRHQLKSQDWFDAFNNLNVF